MSPCAVSPDFLMNRVSVPTPLLNTVKRKLFNKSHSQLFGAFGELKGGVDETRGLTNQHKLF
uniref:Bm13399 n=1 Tax=Brugia malayi TaxID=6279 RepID=A0A0J9XQI7_BRUMA|nr:Bm13399 [Brugia malayi]